MMYCLLSLILYAIPFSIEWSSLPSGGIIAVECAGDVNSDGTEDVYAASNSYGIGCLDGISGDVLWWKSGIPKPYSTECFRTVGDIDLDGVADLAVGTGVEYAIIAISGATGDILWISKQNEIPLFIQKANGPEPGDVFVLASKVHPYDWCEFFALDGQSGYLAWSTSLISTLSFLMCVTENDVSGNGWSEMGYVIDRSTVMNGAACVRDGHTGVNIGGAGAWFYPSMDITDTPIPCLAVSNWGNDPVMWVEDIITGITVWSSNDPSLSFQVLKFIPNITGAATPYPEILSRQGVNIRLIRGDDGYFQDTYTFPASIKSVESYLDGSLWRAAVTTSTSLHCPLLTFESPSIEPSVQLPGSGGTDMCFLNSDLYPTPLIAISMGGSPGACMISTSWPVSISEETFTHISTPPAVTLMSVPGIGYLDILGQIPSDIAILDITGRMVERISINTGERVFVQLTPGVYHIVDLNSGAFLCRASVVSE